MKYDDYEWIATRSLLDESGMHAGLMRLSRPRLMGEVWECAFVFEHSVGGPSKPTMAYGRDSFQALVVALDGIRTYLKTSQPSLSWLGAQTGTGFPAQIPYGLGATVHDRLEKLVFDELAAHVENVRTELEARK